MAVYVNVNNYKRSELSAAKQQSSMDNNGKISTINIHKNRRNSKNKRSNISNNNRKVLMKRILIG